MVKGNPTQFGPRAMAELEITMRLGRYAAAGRAAGRPGWAA
ncbi:MAG: hypothetical protein OXL34_18020 [Gemmatimonadota bacterium]|nr:hypothetical protein [Gemmatimonadota bacterium]